MTDNADQQVREVLGEVHAAWKASDADALAWPYAGEATAAPPGSYLSGRQADAFRNSPEQVSRDAE